MDPNIELALVTMALLLLFFTSCVLAYKFLVCILIACENICNKCIWIDPEQHCSEFPACNCGGPFRTDRVNCELSPPPRGADRLKLYK